MRKNLIKYVVLGAAPLGLTLAASAVFHEWVWRTISSNVAMNMKILVSMLVGAALMYWRVWEMCREDRWLRRFTEIVGKSARDKAQAGAGDESDEDRAVRTARMREVLDSKAFQKLDIHKVLEPVAATGGHIRSRVDQAAIEAEIHTMKENMESRWEFPNFFVGFLVALGLLGTFIGLLETLVGTSELIGAFGGGGNLDEAIGKLVTGLQKPLGGMGTAFAASMFGLVGSLVLGMTMMAVRACGSALMGNVHATVQQFTERKGPSGSGGVAVSENYLANSMADMLEAQREAQDTFARSLQASLTVQTRVEGVLTKLEALTTAVHAQAEAARKTNDLLHVGPRMREIAELQLLEHKAVVGALLKQTESMESLKTTMQAVDKRLGSQADGAAREREVMRTAVTTIAEGQNATRALVTSVMEDEREARQAYLKEVQALRQSTIDTNSAMAGWGTGLNNLQHVAADQLLQVERQAAAVEQLSGAIEALARNMAAGFDQSSRDAQASRSAQIDIAKQLSGLGTVLRIGQEQVNEHVTRLSEATVQQSAMAGAVGEELRQLKSSIGREVRKELREAVQQVRGAVTEDD